MTDHLQATELAARIRGCQQCSCWRRTTQRVAGVGSSAARVVALARNPGEQEDKRGIPLVGPSGNLCKHMCERLFGVPWPSVARVNVMCCHTANNRAPSPEEVRACAAFREAQLNFFEEKVLVFAMGREAIESMIGAIGKIAEVVGELRRPVAIPNRGRPKRWGVIPLWHPSYLLRDRREAKKFAAEVAPGIRQIVQKVLEQGVPWDQEDQLDLFDDLK